MRKKLLLGCMLFTAATLFRNAHAQDFEWAQNVGGPGGDYGRGIAQDAAGNAYTAGFFTGSADFDPGPGTFTLTSAGSNDAFVLKTDAAGNFLWARNLGGTGQDYAYTIATDNAGNVYTAGRFDGTADFDPGTGTLNLTSAGGADMYIQKMDAAGNLIWARSMGGTATDQINRIAVDAAGNVFATGVFNGAADFDPSLATFMLTSAGAEEAFVLRLNANGNFGWATAIGSTGNDRGYSITTDNAGNVLTTGVFSGTADFDPGAATSNLTSAGNFDFFVQKLSNSGSFIWARNAGGTSLDFGWDITTDDANNVYTTGYFQGTADLDPGSGTASFTSAGNYDIFVQKLDAAGNFAWARHMGGSNDDRGYAVGTDNLGNTYVSGYFIGTADLDPGPGTQNITAAGNADFYVVKLNSAGNFEWVVPVGGTNHDFALDMVVNNNGSMYTTGNFEGPADFNFLPGTAFTLTPDGPSDVFVLKLSQCVPTTSTITATACDAYTSPSGSNTWMVSGTYTETVLNAAGCDSVITFNLTINQSTGSTLAATACNSYTSPSGNQTWTSSGTYADIIPNAAGCDSLLTINLTIHTSSAATLTTSACASYNSPSGNHIWTTSGTYTDTLQNVAGCDSIITINLTVNPITSSTATASICAGDSLLLGGQYQTTAGTYTDLFTSAAGCDSVVTTTLTVNQVNSAVTPGPGMLTAAATGASYQWLDCDNAQQPIAGATGQSFAPTQSGNYALQITQNGCTATSACFAVTVTNRPETAAALPLTLYPNPAAGQVTLSFGQEQKSALVSVYAADGRLVLTRELGQVNSTQLNLNGLAAGVYMLHVETPAGAATRKLIITQKE